MSMTEKPKTPAKSWRDVLPLHPACAMFPPMSPSELAELAEDIQTRGLLNKITLFVPKEGNKYFERGLKKNEWAEKLDLFFLLDGANRLDALECRGVEIVDESGSLNPALTGCVTFVFETWQHPDTNYAIDAYGHALALNRRRRHLTTAQKRDLIAALLKMQPGQSNRQIAQQIQTDDKTVAAVRGKLEATAEIPQLTKTVGADGKARTTAPTRRARRTAEQVLPDADKLVSQIMVREAATPGYALAVARGIAAKLADFPDMPDLLKREPTAPDAHA